MTAGRRAKAWGGVASGRGTPSGGRRVGVVKPIRARGGCLGVIRNTGVEGCEMHGGAAQRASIP